jgi:hypothetical protein
MENTIKLLEKMTARLMTRTMFFYGEGTDTWNEESRTNKLYDSKSYYFVNIQGENGKKLVPCYNPQLLLLL